MPQTDPLDDVALLDIGDELGVVICEIRAVALALDSRSCELDRIAASGLMSILSRQADVLEDIRSRIKPCAEDPEEADADTDGDEAEEA